VDVVVAAEGVGLGEVAGLAQQLDGGADQSEAREQGFELGADGDGLGWRQPSKALGHGQCGSPSGYSRVEDTT
jgi:hypothetical protein